MLVPVETPFRGISVRQSSVHLWELEPGEGWSESTIIHASWTERRSQLLGWLFTARMNNGRLKTTVWNQTSRLILIRRRGARDVIRSWRRLLPLPWTN